MSKKAEEDTEKNAWRFVDLVFTGKYYTKQQHNNLVNLAEKLKIDENYEQYIDLDIKRLIYDTVNGTNTDLQKTLENCFNTLYYSCLLYTSPSPRD